MGRVIKGQAQSPLPTARPHIPRFGGEGGNTNSDPVSDSSLYFLWYRVCGAVEGQYKFRFSIGWVYVFLSGGIAEGAGYRGFSADRFNTVTQALVTTIA